MKRKINEILEHLHLKFGENLKLCLSEDIAILEEVEIKAKGTYILGELIHKDGTITETQKEISNIYPEIFTDLTISIYLASCAIDNSPKILLRRVLELGIAVVYLWDIPYKYWNWKNNDDYNNDLNFKEMLDYLNNTGYIDYINQENDSSVSNLVNKNSITKVYRELSNVIHGKYDNFESNNPDRFKHKKEDLLHILDYVLVIENILLSIWKKRFPKHFAKMESELLAITKYTYEY